MRFFVRMISGAGRLGWLHGGSSCRLLTKVTWANIDAATLRLLLFLSFHIRWLMFVS